MTAERLGIIMPLKIHMETGYRWGEPGMHDMQQSFKNFKTEPS